VFTSIQVIYDTLLSRTRLSQRIAEPSAEDVYARHKVQSMFAWHFVHWENELRSAVIST
jgi:hypothetical protein